jgi:hypothetical protein
MMNRQSLTFSTLFLLCSFQFFSVAALAQMPALSPLPGTGQLSSPSNANQFTFVLAGDNRPAHSWCSQPPTPGKIFDAVHQMNPAAAFVLWTGDTISGKNPDESVLKKQYAEFLKLAAKAGVPIFNAPGNHEMDDSKEVPRKEMKVFYRKYMAGTYGAFSYGNSRFIALDSENEPPKAVKQISMAEGSAKAQPPGYITEKQLTLLKDDLEANKDKAHIVIFMHHPVEPYGKNSGLDNAEALKKKFAKYTNVSYVVSGHEHMYYNPLGGKDKLTDPPQLPPGPNDPKPPYYLVSGGGGAPLKQNTAGSFYHYLIFKVDGDRVTPSLVKVDPFANLCPPQPPSKKKEPVKK